MSLQDLDIVRRCEALLQSEPTFKSLALKPDVLHAMKAVLSYHHIRKQTKTPLLDTDYLLAVPVLVSAMMSGTSTFNSGKAKAGPAVTTRYPGLRTDHLVTTKGLGTLVEQFSTFMATRPTYMKESYNQDFKEGMKRCSSKIASSLENLDKDLAEHLRKILIKEDKELPLAETMKQVIRPMIRTLFVGYLSLDAVMYVWDQYVLGLDAPDYDIVPSVAILILIYLKRFLLTCTSVSDVNDVLKSECPKLKREQFMHGIQKHFHKELYSSLLKDGGLPVLDPTQMPMPWRDWHREELPPVVRPEDRQMDRQRRKDEELREREKGAEMEHERLAAELKRKHRERDRWQQQLDDALSMAADREKQLVQLLEEEKKRRAEAAQRDNDQIKQLMREVERLKKGSKPEPTPSPTADPIPPTKVGQDLLSGVMKAAHTMNGK